MSTPRLTKAMLDECLDDLIANEDEVACHFCKRPCFAPDCGLVVCLECLEKIVDRSEEEGE